MNAIPLDKRPLRQHSRTRPLVALVLGLWFLAALAVGLSGAFYRVPVPVVGLTNGSLVALVLGAVYFVRPLRAWVGAVSLRALLLYHTVRLVGIAFLALHARGGLADAFAAAGWGDILVAVTALAVARWAVPITSRGRFWTVFAWNALGLIDIGMVIGMGMRLGVADIDQIAVMTAFPLSLLPTFVVPLIISTHVLIFARLWQARAERSVRHAAVSS